ncbi:hypothetical protein CGCVW01_v008844 [Colletotrichum viniferum]|nr:hypothetical protein CGCVW01_v008844 [Colletotrichum viniferum]
MHQAFGSGDVENPDKPEVYSRPLVDGVGPRGPDADSSSYCNRNRLASHACR